MRIPSATYRFQFGPKFRFQEAFRILSYLSDLGVSDIYASPIFAARKGSSHGYDIIDHGRINPELGGKKEFLRLATTAKTYGLGWLQDIVPNHMAYDSANKMLMDVLEKGPDSVYYRFFDIHWDHFSESLKGQVLAPFLGKFYAECLKNREIRLRMNRNKITVRYGGIEFPLRIGAYERVLTSRFNRLQEKIHDGQVDGRELLRLLDDMKNFRYGEDKPERREDAESLVRRFGELVKAHPAIKKFVRENIRRMNGRKRDPASFGPLDRLLSNQFFRLSFWKVATEEINYRRFFNMNDLICLRVEQSAVFDRIHALVLDLVREGIFTGLRIDHVDGLYDPTGYFRELRRRTGNLFIIAEKILDIEEQLPQAWPIQGTTGYDSLNIINGLFCRTENKSAFDRLYAAFVKTKLNYDDLAAAKKRSIIGKHMAGDVDILAHLMKKISSRSISGRDITLYGLRRVLVEVLAQFPVYRTYRAGGYIREEDRKYLETAFAEAEKKIPDFLYELRFVERILLGEPAPYLDVQGKDLWLDLVMRFQQLTGPLMAKGVEDTVFYIYNRLLSLNEVGGDPDAFGLPLQKFHGFNRRRAENWPCSLTAASTHDTKRGEDVRARINVLSEIPQEWEKTIKRWKKINREKKRRTDGCPVPDSNDEYFLYQTLVGAFPFEKNEYPAFGERLKPYLIKAVREAKVHTAWIKPDAEYEQEYLAFVDDILRPAKNNVFLQEFLPFQKKVAFYGILNSLSQTLLKLTIPGVPDFYQGSELWDLNLVDPDNRRPVDYKKRESLLKEIKKYPPGGQTKLIRNLLSNKEDGTLKLFLIHKVLRARKSKIGVFQEGDYIPVEAKGNLKDHVVAFIRRSREGWALSVVPRFSIGITEENRFPLGEKAWGDTLIVLPPGSPSRWREMMTGQVLRSEGALPVAEVLSLFPVALLFGVSNRPA
jgi:(1->4)-alpha-D-glucan 1-alpha-D-glucosylmutase